MKMRKDKPMRQMKTMFMSIGILTLLLLAVSLAAQESENLAFPAGVSFADNGRQVIRFARRCVAWLLKRRFFSEI
jgi:hypothetical protein